MIRTCRPSVVFDFLVLNSVVTDIDDSGVREGARFICHQSHYTMAAAATCTAATSDSTGRWAMQFSEPAAKRHPLVPRFAVQVRECIRPQHVLRIGMLVWRRFNSDRMRVAATSRPHNGKHVFFSFGKTQNEM